MSETASDVQDNGPLQITVTGGTVLQWPVSGTIVNGYGADLGGRPNKGVNIKVADNTPVHASGGGEVIFAGESESYGNLVIIAHNDMNHAAYGYLGSIDVAKGDIIARDQVIGTAGTPEGSDVPTLHFEMRLGPDHESIDPAEVLGTLPAAFATASIAAPASAPVANIYKVKANDSLWNIAKKEYGFSDDAANYPAIQNAMDHIASLNPFLAEGVRANHITIGEDFVMPDAAALETEPAIRLDHAALDADMRGIKLVRGDFSMIDGGNPILVGTTGEDTTVDFTIGKGGTLSETIFKAAIEDGITLSQQQLRTAVTRVAQENDIANANRVQAGQPVHITRDMYGIGSP